MARGRGHLKVCSLTSLEDRLDSQTESAGSLTTWWFQSSQTSYVAAQDFKYK